MKHLNMEGVEFLNVKQYNLICKDRSYINSLVYVMGDIATGGFVKIES
jgi:hypothetical protein